MVFDLGDATGSGPTIGIDAVLDDRDPARKWKAIGLAGAICGNAYRRPQNCADMMLPSARADDTLAIRDSIRLTDSFFGTRSGGTEASGDLLSDD